MIIHIGVDGSFELQRKGVVTVLLDRIRESQPISAGVSTFNWANGWHWTVVMYFARSNLVCPVVSHDEWGIRYIRGPSTLKKWVKHEIPSCSIHYQDHCGKRVCYVLWFKVCSRRWLVTIINHECSNDKSEFSLPTSINQ